MKIRDRLNNLTDIAAGNLILLCAMIVGYISTVICSILNDLHIFSLAVPSSYVSFMLVILAILICIPLSFGIVTNGKVLFKDWFMYYLLIFMFLWLAVECSMIFFHMTLLLLFPIFVSRCYNIPKVNHLCACMSICLIALTPFTAYLLGGLDSSFLMWFLQAIDPDLVFPELEAKIAFNSLLNLSPQVQFLLWIVLPRLICFSSLLVLSILGNYFNRKFNRKQLSKLDSLKDSIIDSMSDIVENRDASTGGHVKRVQDSVRILVTCLRDEYDMPDEYWDDIIKASSLHDLGKIAIEDSILNKPGRLTDEEFAQIKTHPVKSKIIVDQILKNIDDAELLSIAENIALYHHEKYDGSGYPEGLRGEEIPFEARVLAIADVYDALVSERCYKKPFTPEQAYNIIIGDMGTHFDPELMDAFEKTVPQLEAYYAGLRKSSEA